MRPGNELDIIAVRRGGRPVLWLRGALDVSSGDQLRRAIDTALERNPPVLVLDVSGLEFTDCAGLSVLIWAHRRLAGRGHQLAITGATPMVRRLLHLTGLDSYLHLSSHEPELSNLDLDRSTPDLITPEQRRSALLRTTAIPGPAADAGESAHADLEPR